MCRAYDRVMRTSSSFLLLAAMSMVGCASMMSDDARFETRNQHAGTVPLAFTNASPDRMCGLYMTQEGGKFGDNWLPVEGLPVGKSLEVKVKPGKYRATWNTCKQGSKPQYAGTLTMETSFDVKDQTQLFAYVADTVAPTKRAAPRDFYKMIKFPGQEVGLQVAQQQETSEPAPEPAKMQKPDKADKPDMGAFIDYKAAYKNTHGKVLKPAKASLKRTHDVSSARVGYVEKR